MSLTEAQFTPEQGMRILYNTLNHHGIDPLRMAWIKDRGRASNGPQWINVPKPSTLTDLLVGLHEIGHKALGHRRIQKIHSDIGMMFETAKLIIIAQERAAWRFALFVLDQHEVEINHHTLATCRVYLHNYETCKRYLR